MKTLAYLEIPKMFDVYANTISYETGFHEVQYFCTECSQLFSAAWGRAGMNSYSERGSKFHCPHCGTHFSREKNGWGAKGENVPKKVSLLIRERKDSIDLEVRYSAYTFRGHYDLLEVERKETFRFDIKARRSLWWVQGLARNQLAENSFDLGNPMDFTLFERSILSHFNASCQMDRCEITDMLRTLREAVEAKTEARQGRPMKSTWVSQGEHGMLLLPLYNLAWRTVFPDAPNLPDQYRASLSGTRAVLSVHLLTDSELMERAMAASRTGADYITAMLLAAEIPNIASARKIVQEDWMRNLGRLKAAFDICPNNNDLAIRLFRAIQNTPNQCHYTRNWIGDLARLSTDLLPVFGQSGIVRLVERGKEYYLADCLSMYRDLKKLDVELLRRERIRLRDLHDHIARQTWLNKHQNIDLNVPEHIVRRLAMQSDKLKFFLPKESMDLFLAGKSLHNCVASYGEAVKDRQKWVVLVADAKGKLAACLEIKKDKLVQAKLDSNKPVSNNPALNKEVLEWAEAARLTIDTRDVKIPEKKNTAVAVAM